MYFSYVIYYGGSGEIRTHGAFRHDSFQDCCNKPDSATLPNLVPPKRLELSHLSIPEPKSGASTNFAKGANRNTLRAMPSYYPSMSGVA